jgi:poly(3-hydroxybutyrate) depolymerase
MRSILFALFALFALASAQNLKQYNINTSAITVSGVSSGGAMAIQVHVSYSSVFSGIGIFAGPPWFCAFDQVSLALTACTADPTLLDLSVLLTAAKTASEAGFIDDLSNLANQPVWAFSGTADTVVLTQVVMASVEFYQSFQSRTNFTEFPNAEHSWVTNNYGNGCSTLASPYINNCNFDGAQNMLEYLYGPLNAKTSTVSANYLTFSQSSYVPSGYTLSDLSMPTSGVVYVPTSCQKGNLCKLHVVFHGCNQDLSQIGQVFVQNTGVNQWAESNDIIVLYPQATTSEFEPENPEGCWDWWGYTNAEYATQAGPQIQTVRSMVQALTGH